MSEQQTRDWSEIPRDILERISTHVKVYSDYIRFRVVCPKWRSILPRLPRHRLPVQLPWLLLIPPPRTATTHQAFYDVSTGKTHSIHLPQASLPRYIVGSSHGSLIIAANPSTIFCFNPITKFRASLAPLSTLPRVISTTERPNEFEYVIQDRSFPMPCRLGFSTICRTYLNKVILSDSPTEDACLAMAITGFLERTDLAYCKCGDDTWKPWPYHDFNPQDVIYSQSDNLFYVINQPGDVAYFSTIDNVNFRRNDDTIEGDFNFLVKFNEELLLVSKHSVYKDGPLPQCQVYKFREVGQGTVQWEPATDLGDLMMFIGESFSLGLLASDFAGCKGNCVYFALSTDAGVYNLSNGQIEELPRSEGWNPPLLRTQSWKPPIWFTPNPSYV